MFSRLVFPLSVGILTTGVLAGMLLLPNAPPQASPTVAAAAEPAEQQPATTTPPAAAPQESIRVRAPAPSRLTLKVALPARETASYQALALYFRTSLFARPSKRLDVIGFARRGTRIPVQRAVSGAGCRKGSWYLVHGGAYVCTSRGFLVGTKPRMRLSYAQPKLEGLLPHRYGKVIRDGAERLYRVPTPAEDERIVKAVAKNQRPPDVVEKAMKGIYFVAIGGEKTNRGRRFYRTVRGRYVRQKDVELRSTPPMHGELLGDDKLPLAFVFDKHRPLYRRAGDSLRAVGVIEKHARFRPVGRVKLGAIELLRTDRGLLVDRRHVRLVEQIRRPGDVPARAKWIHVDLAQQTLTAYEDETPVFATLVSSGKQGFEPPVGTYRIHRKYVSTTMNGPDPDQGWYEVEEVPWTMYYLESYALHGTYWHNDFGRSRSHGCTNLAPADAKWLFYWADPPVPYGWHAREKRGTRVHFTKVSSG